MVSRSPVLVFTAYRDRNTQTIDMIELATGKRWTLISLGGLNITPALSPDGNFLAFASSHEGNSELYRGYQDKNHPTIDCKPVRDLSPSWSPNGRELVFVSDRAAAAVIPHGFRWTNVRRLTFDGDYMPRRRGRPVGTGLPMCAGRNESTSSVSSRRMDRNECN